MTHTEKVKVFEEELKSIPHPAVQIWVENCLGLVPDYFFEIGASVTGKYHPYWTKGRQGLVKHTRAVVRVAESLVPSMAVNIETNNNVVRAVVIASAILHDSFKYGPSFDMRLHDLHPYMPRLMFKNVPHDMTDAMHEVIFRAIEAHMGSAASGDWSLMPYVTTNTLKENKAANILHLADYIASRTFYIDDRFIDDHDEAEGYEPYEDKVIIGLLYGTLLDVVPDELVVKIVQDKNIQLSIINRIRALKDDKEKKGTYNLENILKTLKDNSEWIIKDVTSDV